MRARTVKRAIGKDADAELLHVAAAVAGVEAQSIGIQVDGKSRCLAQFGLINRAKSCWWA